MSATRRWASRLLTFVARHSSSVSRDWANAMLRELDFIDREWVALFWALGSATAVFRHSVPRGLRAWLEQHSHQEAGLTAKNIGKKAAGLISGVVIAIAVLTICVFGLVRLSLFFFPGWDVERVQW